MSKVRPKFKTKLDSELFDDLVTKYIEEADRFASDLVQENESIASNLEAKNSPVGSVTSFTGNQIPEGWLLCNGLAISRSTYSNLFNLIGISHGRGDNLTTFNLPNYQGLFLRGRANGSGNDPNRTTRTALATGGATGDNVGSFQNMDWKGFSQTNTGQNTGSFSHGPVFMGKSTTSFTGNLFVGRWASPAAAMGTLWDTSEIRPRNVYVNYIIKF
jgi:phage-related tail fiber protein